MRSLIQKIAAFLFLFLRNTLHYHYFLLSAWESRARNLLLAAQSRDRVGDMATALFGFISPLRTQLREWQQAVGVRSAAAGNVNLERIGGLA